MPAGDPELGRSRSDRQLLGNDLENSNTRSRHARDCPPTPGQATPGDRRSGTRSARASATTAGTPVNPRTQVRPMSRLMSDLSPETYVLNPDTSLSADSD